MKNFFETTPSKVSILMAEDDPFIARMYETKIASAGYKISIHNNGRDAYDAIKSMNPDLIIMDINMPELSGLEVMKLLQQDGFDFKTHPVIVLTNSSNVDDMKAAHSFGADYLIKAELTPKDVLERIKSKLG